jgi:hypothetical protein
MAAYNTDVFGVLEYVNRGRDLFRRPVVRAETAAARSARPFKLQAAMGGRARFRVGGVTTSGSSAGPDQYGDAERSIKLVTEIQINATGLVR